MLFFPNTFLRSPDIAVPTAQVFPDSALPAEQPGGGLLMRKNTKKPWVVLFITVNHTYTYLYIHIYIYTYIHIYIQTTLCPNKFKCAI